MSLAKSLRRILEIRKMTVAQLSRSTGVPAKTIYHWLSGQQPRKIEHVFKVCDTLNVSIEEMYGRKRRNSLEDEFSAGVYEVILRPISKP
ncbi:helix-turn-helix transcriptional regulator [Bdellovibrio sp. 22V]|uniref:helix-turn-helix transcriptional regulator n=1 Tax=Bdellovibrio TaxID=958 RepID=UPI002542DC6B|nr:helix-turn-helix transcriptional regulator [Bdellovibrio sp. 22V]WII71688.1 helix-turn-helix transcriptional regulator [Bdellovibrio sp. 22V]